MKLVYFDVKGLAEISRYLLAYLNIQYEDYRYPLEISGDASNRVYTKVEFEEDKKNGKFVKSFGKLPYLDVDSSLVISQSKAIERYLAEQHGLMGSNASEKARIDNICECIRDIKDSSKNNENFVLETQLFDLAKMMNTFPNADICYSVGSKISLADITLFNLLHDVIKYNNWKTCPIKIRSIYNTVLNNENINKWISTRKDTMF